MKLADKKTAGRPKLSVLMASFNNEPYIKAAIDSVLAQDFQAWELLVGDDASTDGSWTMIESYDNSRIRAFQNDKNRGYIAGLKKLLAKARSDIILILDGDDTLAAGALAAVWRAFNESSAVFVYSDCYYCDADLRIVHRADTGPIPAGQSNLQLNKIVHLKSFRKSAYEKTAGYDSRMLFAEDLDLNLKMEELGPFYFINEPLYHYRVKPVSQTHGLKNKMIHRSSVALAKLNAYERRLGTDIPNLNQDELAVVLGFGIASALLSVRLDLLFKFIFKLVRHNPFFAARAGFYREFREKLDKYRRLKSEKPLI